MIELDPSKFKLPPYPYQLDGVKHIIKRESAAVFDEMGVGKTKQTIDAACILFENKIINAVIVVAPASVRGVWDNAETGEIPKHSWVDYISIRYDKDCKLRVLPTSNSQLLWITVSYSFLRARLTEFLDLVKSSNLSFLLVLDESSYVKSEKAQQSKAAWKLRQFAKRCVLLNGTPVANNIMDLWMQFNILDPKAINNMNYYHYRAKYAILKKEENHRLNTTFTKIVGFKEDEVQELKKQLAPWIIRREKKDVLKDLPPKLPPVYWEVPLSPKAWKMYEDMREEMVSWLDNSTFSAATNAAVVTGRLSQITSGFLGGFKVLDGEITEEQQLQEIDDSKLKAFLEWRTNNPDIQVLTWCRWRAEMLRVKKELEKVGFTPGIIIGGQKDEERQDYVTGFQKKQLTDLVGNPGAGGFGLNLTNCSTAVYLSNSHSLIKRLQSEDRIHRNGQLLSVSYVDILATTPSGGKTIDHLIVKALHNKENMATWTVDKWKTIIEEI